MLAGSPDLCRFDSLTPNDSQQPGRDEQPQAFAPARWLQQRLDSTVPQLIVLAEDSAELRALLAYALENVGYRVVQVGTGTALVDTVVRLTTAGEAVRLIITDVRMPALGGVDAAGALREAGLQIPLIFMTAYGDAWTRSRAEQLGAILLDKPLTLATLREAVRRTIIE